MQSARSAKCLVWRQVALHLIIGGEERAFLSPTLVIYWSSGKLGSFGANRAKRFDSSGCIMSDLWAWMKLSYGRFF